MIDRSPSRLHFCLRPKTIATAAFASASVFLALPLAALICVVAGGLAYAGCLLGILLLALAGGVLAIVGGIALAVGLLGGQSEATGGGVVAGGVGLLGLVLCNLWSKPVRAAGEAALSHCSRAAEFLTIQVFVGHHVYLWPWFILVTALTVALALLVVIGILRCESLAKAHLLGIRYTCPACHERSVPQFRCPTCATLASDLVPSRYGIFQAHCEKCQAALPTLDLLGRLALQKACRTCSANLLHPAIGKQREIHFAILGAQSSGKTTLMVASLWQLAQQFAPKNGLQVEFANNRQNKVLHNTVQGLASGRRMAKTVSMPQPRAFNVAIHAPDRSGCLLYLYDAAGEDFTDEARMSGHRFHRFVDGVLLVIDPFAEALARPGTSGAIERNAYSAVNPAASDVSSVIEPFINRLEQQMNVAAESQFPVPIAVVVTKIQAMSNAPWSGMAKELSLPSGIGSSPEEVRGAATAAGASSSVVRQFLLNLGLANVALGLEARFPRVRYFATSSVEELPSPNRQPAPARAAIPLWWLIRQAGALSGARPRVDVPVAARPTQDAFPEWGEKALDCRYVRLSKACLVYEHRTPTDARTAAPNSILVTGGDRIARPSGMLRWLRRTMFGRKVHNATGMSFADDTPGLFNLDKRGPVRLR